MTYDERADMLGCYEVATQALRAEVVAKQESSNLEKLGRATLQDIKRGVLKARLAGANQGDRQKDDFYATPPSCTRALLAVEEFSGGIWEPACGDGAISRVLQESGRDVISTDLVERGFGQSGVDFLMEYRPLAPNVITNPPFKNGTEFVAKALSLTTGKVAMLLKVGFLEGVGRATLYDQAPFARLWIFRGRQSFLKNGKQSIKINGAGGMIAYGWFVWEHGYTGKPTLGWI